jgi:hypothetical protein
MFRRRQLLCRALSLISRRFVQNLDMIAVPSLQVYSNHVQILNKPIILNLLLIRASGFWVGIKLLSGHIQWLAAPKLIVVSAEPIMYVVSLAIACRWQVPIMIQTPSNFFGNFRNKILTLLAPAHQAGYCFHSTFGQKTTELGTKLVRRSLKGEKWVAVLLWGWSSVGASSI